MYKDGKTLKEIGEELKICPNRLSKWLKEQEVNIKRLGGKPNKRVNFFEKIDTEEKAYWLGFLYADGSVNLVHKGERVSAIRLEIGLNSCDEEHLEKFMKDIDYTTKISRRLIRNKYETSRIIITDTEMCRDLINLGCVPAKSLVLDYPTSEQVPYELRRHFIRGYVDGDGSIGFKHSTYKDKIYKRPYLTILGTKRFLQGVLYNTNWKNNKIQEPSNAFQIEWCGKNVVEYLDFLYKDATVYLERKYNKYLEIKQNCRLD